VDWKGAGLDGGIVITVAASGQVGECQARGRREMEKRAASDVAFRCAIPLLYEYRIEDTIISLFYSSINALNHGLSIAMILHSNHLSG